MQMSEIHLKEAFKMKHYAGILAFVCNKNLMKKYYLLWWGQVGAQGAVPLDMVYFDSIRLQNRARVDHG